MPSVMVYLSDDEYGRVSKMAKAERDPRTHKPKTPGTFIAEAVRVFLQQEKA
jgi:hypothetical protein